MIHSIDYIFIILLIIVFGMGLISKLLVKIFPFVQEENIENFTETIFPILWILFLIYLAFTGRCGGGRGYP